MIPPLLRRARRSAFAAWALALAGAVAALPAPARAAVTRVVITSRQPVLGGRPFGAVGAYEKLRGTVYFTLDPNNPHDRIIANLDLAPRDARGLVEFSADLIVLQPVNPAAANGDVLLDILNRGRLEVLSDFNRARGSADPTTPAQFGDGYLMRQGYTIVGVGWEFDLPPAPGLVLLRAPIATRHGRPITGWVNPWFIPSHPTASYEYASHYYTPAYPPLHPDDPAYRLTVRAGGAAAPGLIPRADWHFGRLQGGKLVPDPNWVTLQRDARRSRAGARANQGGFQPGLTYQVNYQSQNPPVAGVGFAAVRDFASAMKYSPSALVHARHVLTYGASQTGRWQREMIYEGFTVDEQGRQAVDALMVQTGGTATGGFNRPFAQPDDLGSFTHTVFPIRYETTTDPVTGRRDGLGARIPPALAPKIFFIDTGSEYWDRGRVAALRHTSLDGTRDLPDPPNVRVYTLAGTRHAPGSWPPAMDGSQQLPANPNDYRWIHRALLAALHRWVDQGVLPPPSRHPLLSDGSLIHRRDIKFPAIPGVQWPYFTPGGFRDDLRGAQAVLPLLVPQVDADGNDIGGIHTPEQAVPLGTYTDWAFRSPAQGAPFTQVEMAGSFIPFAKTRALREQAHRGGRAALPAGKIGAKGCDIPQGGPPPGNEFGAAPARRSADLGPGGPQVGASMPPRAVTAGRLTSGTRAAGALGPAPTKDPRRSLAERYPSRAAYLRLVQQYATREAQQGYLLPADVPTIVRDAGHHWDWIISQGNNDWE